MLAVSDLVLIILDAPVESFAHDHDGMSPQRISGSLRMGSLGFWRMAAVDWVGAMLKPGAQSGSSEPQSKYSSTTCFRRDNLKRPHMRKIMADWWVRGHWYTT